MKLIPVKILTEGNFNVNLRIKTKYIKVMVKRTVAHHYEQIETNISYRK